MFTPTETQLPSMGAALRAMREGVGLTISELADRSGTTKSTLSRFENGQRTISADLLSRVARAIADEAHAKRRVA